ncbi:hypothetical protein [Plantactinospora soyae]|uniref:Uncharacterized protein n=1 Tax=Plantactinospora soyae TaxID=1544732 RepID=A0A927QX62_9ACTN|nr:hypothetical protein [Plantactinospora soyae]MBE1485128.1 hypothetical protein [Plantactinospora soyae]
MPVGGARGALRTSKRTWQWVVGSLGVLVLLGICGLSSYFFVNDEPYGRDARTADSTPPPGALNRDISSRAADPTPLTVKEVFPGKEIVIAAEESKYELLKTQASEDCELVADGELGALLVDLGCSQFVRGTVRSPTGAYVATAGIVNLTDAAGATSAREKIQPIVTGEKGRFLGLAAGRGTEAVARESAQAGWHERGHFLIYCVVAKTNGTTIGEEDVFARQVLTDMIEAYLRGKVLEQRATAAVDPSGSAGPDQPPN